MAPLAQAAGQVPPGVDPMAYYLSMPALQPAPPGADTHMTTNGPDQVWYLVVAATCTIIPGLFLLLRIYTKVFVVRMIEIADYFIFLSFPLIVIEIVMGYYMVKWGAGVHQWQVTLGQLFNQLYWMNTAEVIYCPLSFLVKMAILLQYIRLFAPSRQLNRLMWYGAWATMAACFVFYTVLMFWTLFYCTPRKMIWFKLTPGGKCNDHTPIVIAQGSFNMASDIIILLLPTTSLWKLNVPTGRKVVVTLLFATGLLACVASTMRIVWTIKIAPIFTEADVSHNGLFIGLWTEAEVALGFIVACSLSLPRLIQANRSKFSRVFSYASSPFSSFRSTFKSTSRKSTQNSSSNKSTQDNSRGLSHGSTPMIQAGLGLEGKRPAYYEERMVEEQRQRGIYPIREERDAYALPSISGSSDYSMSARTSRVSDVIASPVRITPLRWDPRGIPHGYEISPIDESSIDTSRISGTGSRTTNTDTDASSSIIVLNGTRADGARSSHRLTQDELFVLQQFRFTRFEDSIDIEQTADQALQLPLR